ncbi:MAG TPA: hybrid sensor histidine kinase/response regulator [Pyrinomonadaceae bacterium]|jgi:signal transduction histidine kinase/ActR/RegA family two-component response regulator
MDDAETVNTVRTDVSRSALTARLGRALTLQSLVQALADKSLSDFVAFDYCQLVMLEAHNEEIRVWRALRSDSGQLASAPATDSDAEQKFFARRLAAGSSSLIKEAELQQEAGGVFERDTRSALLLPLSTGGHCFGLLCFASFAADAYTTDDEARLGWLADYVAQAAQAALLRAKLETLSEAEREIERLKSGFLNTLVRDIRLPLTSVLGLLELFESKLQAREPFDLEDRQLLNAAIENGDRMRHLLDDHLEIAQQHERPLALNPEITGVEALLEEVTEPFRGEAALRGVELNIHVGAGKLEMRADRRQARRALCHLLTAALAATPDGGAVNIDARSIIGTRASDEGRQFVVVNMTDSSQGIPAEEVPFVFDAFWQAADPRAVANAGRGLGLAIAKRIAAAHEGNVSVRSQRGLGTTYSLVLPVGERQTASDQRRILIVDDVPELLLLLRKLVARMGYQVEIASGAHKALAILREKKVDLLLTDWAMPEMNGGELIAALKRDESLRHIPTIILTGHDTERERDEAQAIGCDRFLVKPVKRDELQRVILELLPTEAAVAAK